MPKHPQKKYYWFKLKDNFFTDPKIKKLRRIAGGDTYTVILLKTMLLTLKTDGILIHEGIENTLSDELALKLDEDEKNVEATLIFMQNMQLIQEIDINKFDLPQVRALTGVESDSAERVRRYREKKKTLHCNTEETACNKNVTTEKEIENKREEKEPLSLSLSVTKNENFDQFRSRIRNDYSGSHLIQGPPHFLKDTIISLSLLGYLHNEVSGRDLNSGDAINLWKWLFINQHRMLSIKKGEKK